MKRGSTITEVLRLEDSAELQATIQRAASLHQPLSASSVSAQVLTAPGETLVLTLTAAPIDQFEDDGPAVVIIFRNTTAENRVQTKYQRLLAAKRQHAVELESKVRERTRELAETQEELLQATRLAAVGEVAGAAAHEVFNPLTAVTGNLENLRNAIADEASTIDELMSLTSGWKLALDAGGHDRLAEVISKRSDDESQLEILAELCEELGHDLLRRRNTLEMVCNAGRRIERIIQGMLGMARGQAEPELLRLSQVLREVRDLMAYSFDRAGVSLEIDSPHDVSVYVDRGELLQVLTNLLRNGCQAANQAHGAKGGHVSVRTATEAHNVIIEVEDNGVGVPEDVQPRIFDAGFTTKPRGEGSGLGLPISRRLVRRSGGDLVLRASGPGKGTTMIITLPVVESTHAEETHE